MKLSLLGKILICLLTLSAAGTSAFCQTNLSDLSVAKTKWRAIVTKRMPGVQGWNAGFPTERSVDPKDPKTYGTGGDSLMYAAYLCSVGERDACNLIPNSLEPSGQLRRNPLLKGQPNGSSRGSLSKDHTLAAIYWLSLPDNIVPADVKRNFAVNWQKSFDQVITTDLECKAAICLTNDVGPDAFERMVANSGNDLSPFLGQSGLSLSVKLPSLSVETLKTAADNVGKAVVQPVIDGSKKALDAYKKAVVDKEIAAIKGCLDNSAACVENYVAKVKGAFDTISTYMLDGAQQLQGCLASDKDVTNCIKANVKGSESYVKGMIAAVSFCAEGLAQGADAKAINQTELGRCAVNLLTAALALPKFCEDLNCVLPPTQMVYLNRIYKNLGLAQPFNSALFDLLGIDSEETALMSADFSNMDKSNLVALNVLVRRNLGLKSSRLAGRLINRYPSNPFFQSVHFGLPGSPYTQESMAGLVLSQCKSIDSLWNGKPQYLASLNEMDAVTGDEFKQNSFWRWKTNEQDQFNVDPLTQKAEKISLVWDCIFMADTLKVKEYPVLTVPASSAIVVKVKKNENPTVYDTLAKTLVGGAPPLKFELKSQPANFDYFSFDPDTGIFIYRPLDNYSSTTLEFKVSDRAAVTLESKVTIAFDHSEIYPGHPPLTETPTRPLPAAIYPLITITNQVSNQVRTLNDAAESPAELLSVSSGSLDLQAEAFIENVDETYSGNLDCTVDWTSKGGKPALIKDTDEFPRNFFVQKSIDVSSLEPYQVTIFRMNCMAPDMPITTRDIPAVYIPDAMSLKKALDKLNYSYASTNGATLALTYDKNSSTDLNRVYTYALKAMCGQSTGSLVAATNANKLTIDGSFDGLLASGDPQKMVWLNAPVCDKAQPIVWKLLSTNSNKPNIPAPSNAFCRYEHKKDTAGGKSGQISSLDASGKSKSCDKNGDWKTSCKDGNSDTDEIACEDGQLLPPPPPVMNAVCQYKHKKDTSGGKSGQVTNLDGGGKGKSCDKNGDWKTICKDGNSDTDEVGCEVPASTPPAAMCQYKHKKDTAGGKSGQTNSLDGNGKSKSCDKSGEWQTSCKDGNGDTDEVGCQ